MKPLAKMTKSELILKVKELTVFLDALSEEKNQQETISFPWAGNLGNWYWNVKTNSVLFNNLKVQALGYDRLELPESVQFEFFTEKLHPDDYDRVMENMRSHLYGMSPAYECSYRIRHKNGSYLWFHDRGKISKRDEFGKAELVAGIVFDISEQKKMEEALSQQNELLKEMSSTDFLTGINNRRTLFEKLDYEMMRSKRTHEPLSVLLLDLDFFKKINDQYGHLIGDHVLAKTASLIKDNVRVTDIVGRYGGEEFMVILPDCSEHNALAVAEKIRSAIQAEEFENQIKVTISGGLKQYDGESIDIFIELVDRCTYDAKNLGRNRVVSFEQVRVP